MSDLEYQYGGQWFDDMGALAMSFTDAPITGVELANNPLDRIQTNDVAKSLLGSGLSPYYDEEGTVEV
jgi:hypothetical protein